MEITNVTIGRDYTMQNRFKATVRVKNTYSNIELVLDEARTLALIELVGDLLVESARAIATDLVRDSLAVTVPAIAHNSAVEERYRL